MKHSSILTRPESQTETPADTDPIKRSLSGEAEVLVRAQGVGKKFCRDLKKSLWYGIKDLASEINPLRFQIPADQQQDEALRSEEFWANQGISFEVQRGECLGLIGHNGAGKTTLLKMLNGLIKPDTGRIEMRGRVGALIALGAGFNPILTGRENIYVNGSVLGLKNEEIRSKFDEIVDFAEIDQFIDAPVQSYSSGMKVRLGFAIASTLEPDVLILDEVLAVGDVAFRNKCFTRIDSLRSRAAVIFVSHNALQVARICDRVIWLDKGRMFADSTDVDTTLGEYAVSQSSRAKVDSSRTGALMLKTLRINNEDFDTFGELPLVATKAMDGLALEMVFSGESALPSQVTPRVLLLDEGGSPVLEARSGNADTKPLIDVAPGSHTIRIRMVIKSLPLSDGIYSVRSGVNDSSSNESLFFGEILARISVSGNGFEWSKNLICADWDGEGLNV